MSSESVLWKSLCFIISAMLAGHFDVTYIWYISNGNTFDVNFWTLAFHIIQGLLQKKKLEAISWMKKLEAISWIYWFILDGLSGWASSAVHALMTTKFVYIYREIKVISWNEGSGIPLWCLILLISLYMNNIQKVIWFHSLCSDLHVFLFIFMSSGSSNWSWLGANTIDRLFFQTEFHEGWTSICWRYIQIWFLSSYFVCFFTTLYAGSG